MSERKSKPVQSVNNRQIVIIDDHPLFRDAMKGALAGVLTNATVREASSLDDGIKILDD